MTRKRPPQIPDLTPTRRKRQLSEDEVALWDHVARQVKPLRRKKLVVKRTVVEVVAAPEPARPPRSAFAVMIGAAAPAAKSAKAPLPLVPLARRERSQLSRGKREIDARIDLHGMTQSRAHRALLHFLERASGEGFAYVLVITGKGRTSGPESERGILKRQVPEWLSLPEFRPLVIGFEEANIAHGGSGALYVRVRRTRRL